MTNFWKMWLNGLKFLKVNPHLVKFSNHRPWGNSDIAAKMFYVTLQDFVIKGPSDFMEGNSSLHICILPSLLAIDMDI